MIYTKKEKKDLERTIKKAMLENQRRIDKITTPLKAINGLYLGILHELQNTEIDEEFLKRQMIRIEKLTQRKVK